MVLDVAVHATDCDWSDWSHIYASASQAGASISALKSDFGRDGVEFEYFDRIAAGLQPRQRV